MMEARNTQIFRRLDSEDPVAAFDYERAFSRNIGIISSEEQIALGSKCVAIAGSGGVGSLQATILARLGVGQFILGDSRQYEYEHFNSQFGAKCSTVGKFKADVLHKEILDINPEANIEVYKKELRKENMDEFLEGVDVVIDSLGFSALATRDHLIPSAQADNIPVVVAVPLGFSCALLVFTGNSMRYEKYFDFKENDTDLERVIKFAVGLAPKQLHSRYMKAKLGDSARKRGAFIASGVTLCGAMATNETLNILLNRTQPKAVPYYRQFDLHCGKYRKGYIPLGNRNPWQKLKLWFRRKRQTSLKFEK